MIEFKKPIPENKSHLELYFKLLLLNQNIEYIIIGIKKQLEIQNENILQHLKELDLRNPYSVLLLRD